MVSNIHSHQHLTAPPLMAGGLTLKNGVPSPQIFHFDHSSGPKQINFNKAAIVVVEVSLNKLIKSAKF